MKKIVLLGMFILSTLSFSSETKGGKIQENNINKKENFELSIGAMSIYSSNLYKKKSNKLGLVPIAAMTYKNFYLSGTEVGYKYGVNKDLTITGFTQFLGGVPLIGGSAGISTRIIDKEDMDQGYKNIDNRKSQIEGGIKVNYNTEWERVRLSGELRGGEHGGSIKAGIMQPYRIGKKLLLFPQVNLTVMTSNIVNYYFRVTKEEVGRNISDKLDREYDPNKIGYATTLGLGYSYGFNERLALFGILSAQRLSSEIYNSPIVKNKTNYTIGTGLRYSF